MFRKIRTRIIASFAVLIIALTGALLFFIIDAARSYHLAFIKEELAKKIDFIEHAIGENPGAYRAGGLGGRVMQVRRLAGVMGVRITLVGPDGAVIADSEYADVGGMDNHRYRTEILDAASTGLGESVRYSTTLKTDMLYMAKRTDHGIIRLARPLGEVREGIDRLRRNILAAGGAALVLAMIVVVLISRMIKIGRAHV